MGSEKPDPNRVIGEEIAEMLNRGIDPATGKDRWGALPPTITIPVAEYEGLKRRAFSKAELEVLLEWAEENNLTDWHHYDDEVWHGIKCRLAAIKEQEGQKWE